MDYDELLNFATEMGYQLQLSGAEIFRVEDSVQRILSAYGAPTGEVFAIPNCLTVSVTDPDGRPLTRIRRVGLHGTDIYRLEALNDLSRRLCAQVPSLEEAKVLLAGVCADKTAYSYPFQLFAYALGSFAFAFFFGGCLRDAICSAVCGVSIGLCSSFMDKLNTNLFFKTFVGGCVSALVALILTGMGIGVSSDIIIIGALMALVPGIAFTNALRDIIAGDMLSGLSKTAEALLVGASIALGTGAALFLARLLGVAV